MALTQPELSDVVHKIWTFREATQEEKDPKHPNHPHWKEVETEITVDSNGRLYLRREGERTFKPVDLKYKGVLSLDDTMVLVNETYLTSVRGTLGRKMHIGEEIYWLDRHLNSRLNTDQTANTIGYTIPKPTSERIENLIERKEWDDIKPGDIIVGMPLVKEKGKYKSRYFAYTPIIAKGYSLIKALQEAIKKHPFKGEVESYDKKGRSLSEYLHGARAS